MPGESPLPKSVLVVDDEQVVLDVLKIALKKGGYPVTTALTAEEAFVALSQQQFGALITDKNLPGKNGLEVIKEARRLHPFCACLVMTGYANTESVVEAMRLGANDYLEKPFNELGLVLQRLKAAFDHQRVMFERAALADGLREMDAALKVREKEVFAHRTELELLQHVIEMRIDDATRELVVEKAKLEAEREELLGRVSQLLDRDRRMSGALYAEAAKNTALTAEQARKTFGELQDLLRELEK